MQGFHVVFGQPQYLWLLLLIPILVWIARDSLAGLGLLRRWTAICIRVAVCVALVAAISSVRWEWKPEDVEVSYLLVKSDSVHLSQRSNAFSLAKSLQKKFQNTARGDTSGLITFGRKAQILEPLSSSPLSSSLRESSVDGEASNLEDALRMARASFPPGGRRIVLISDGNENLGNAYLEARQLASDGIAIDVAVIPRATPTDVVVDQIETPQAVRQNATFDVTVGLELRSQDSLEETSPVQGQLRVVRRQGNDTSLVAMDTVTLIPGKNFFRFQQSGNTSGFYTYSAEFIPDSAKSDAYAQNNSASSFTQVLGRLRVLWVSANEENLGENLAAEVLRRNEIDVVTRSSLSPFTDLAELQAFDAVVLDNLSRVDQGNEDDIRFPDESMADLVHHVEHFGAGLLMIGGKNSFGLGGWTNTILEKAMPVDFQVRNRKVEAVGALALVIDKSGSMAGDKILMARSAASAAASMLGDNDYIGIYAFDSELDHVVPLQRLGSQRSTIRKRIASLGSGGGTNMAPALRQAYQDLERSSAAVKHLVILTDGITAGENYDELAGTMQEAGMTTSVVSIGPDAAREVLRSIAFKGGGNYYQPASLRAIPKIFMKETRVVLRQLIFEDTNGILVAVHLLHEVFRGIPSELPPVHGFVLTTKKDHPLVESLIDASRPEQPNNSILTAWNYGFGRTVVWTTDSGERWAAPWVDSPMFEKLIVQLLRWSSRPITHPKNFHLSTVVHDDMLRISVNATDDSGSFRNDMSLQGALISLGSGDAQSLSFKQVGPGRYVAEKQLVHSDNYLVSFVPGTREGVLRAGFSFNDSAEYRSSKSNRELLEKIASSQSIVSLTNKLLPGAIGGSQWIDLDLDPNRWQDQNWTDVYRPVPNLQSMTKEIWPLCAVLAAILFFVDVLNRRVAWGNLRRASRSNRPTIDKSPDSMKLDQLRRVKQRAQWLERSNNPYRATMPEDETAPPSIEVPETEKLGYSERLLRAKRNAMGRKDE